MATNTASSDRELIDGINAAIVEAARAAKGRDPGVHAILRADGTVPHARVIRALDLMRDGGLTGVAFSVQGGPSAPLGVEPSADKLGDGRLRR